LGAVLVIGVIVAIMGVACLIIAAGENHSSRRGKRTQARKVSFGTFLLIFGFALGASAFFLHRQLEDLGIYLQRLLSQP
jgi:hypothetical protein